MQPTKKRADYRVTCGSQPAADGSRRPASGRSAQPRPRIRETSSIHCSNNYPRSPESTHVVFYCHIAHSADFPCSPCFGLPADVLSTSGGVRPNFHEKSPQWGSGLRLASLDCGRDWPSPGVKGQSRTCRAQLRDRHRHFDGPYPNG